jgi:N-acetylmuramoyl-L-alanine amidase
MLMRKAFGRGFDSRRLHHIWIQFLFLLPLLVFPLSSFVSGQDQVLTIFEDSRKSEVPLQMIEGTPFVRIVDLQTYLGLQINPAVGNQNVSITSGAHTVILSANRSLVSVDQKLVSLSKPVFLVQGIWMVPLDFIPKVLRGISEKKILWLENSRSLMLGNVQANQVTLKYASEQQYSRIVFQSATPIAYTVYADGNILTVLPQSQDFSAGFQDAAFEDGVVQSVKMETVDNRKIIKIQTGSEYSSYRSFELKDPPRFVIDLYRKGSVAPQAEPSITVPPPQTQEVPQTLLPSTISNKKVIVIDPGHGGTETGAKGSSGTLEKDVTMSIARKLKSMIESTGMRAILTRDGDQVVSLDDRTSKANNNKADLFISIHANATIRGKARGAETYFLSAQATDDESRNIAAVENNALGLSQAPAVEDDLKLILWDMAQTEFLTESSQLAETIQQELNSTLSISNRGIKQAPFRVLTGATMPAVLIEVGFINNPDEEKLMTNGDYQLKIATAIFRSIQKFQNRDREALSKINTGGQ